MKTLITISTLALSIGVGVVAALEAQPANTADTISLEADHPNSFHRFSAELPQLRARALEINTEVGLHLSEIEPGLFLVSDLVYQSAFAVTDSGVVVFDAPPSFGENLRRVIELAAPGRPITHFILSHGHRDHNGGGVHFADIDGLEVIAAAETANLLKARPLNGVLTPTRVFDDALDLSVGGLQIDLKTARFHAKDTDVLIHLPQKKFLMAIDTITPGEAPFMNFGATSDIEGYLASFETFLGYDFEHFLSGHVSVLGTRQDVLDTRDYAFDVHDTVIGLMPSLDERIFEGLTAVEFQNANLAYRYAMESIRDGCAAQIIERWNTRLSVVDLWADSHCETIVLHAIMH